MTFSSKPAEFSTLGNGGTKEFRNASIADTDWLFDVSFSSVKNNTDRCISKHTKTAPIECGKLDTMTKAE